MTRKLTTIRQIQEIKPIPGADLICAYRVDDWWVVDKVGQYNVGDYAIYVEADAWVPTALAPFLSKGKNPRQYHGVAGEKLRTVRLKKQLSQGLLLPLSTIRDCDLSELMGVQLWEEEIPANLAGQMEGSFPSYIPKTDQERCQNIGLIIFGDRIDDEYEVTLKMDGSSCTLFDSPSREATGVCSRNWQLKVNEANAGNTFVQLYNTLYPALSAIGYDVAIQGEAMGPGIQGNRERLTATQFFMYSCYLIAEQRQATPDERKEILAALRQHVAVEHVPVITERTTLKALGITNMQELLDFAVRPSLNNPVAEGLVFKSHNPDGFSFKAISNVYLEEVGKA